MDVRRGPSATPGGDGFDAARDAAREGDAMRAMSLVREALQAEERLPAADVLVSIAELVGADALADAARRVAAAPEDLQALFDLGARLTGAGVPDVAVPVLRQLLELVPGNKTVLAELAVALEDAGRYGAAAALLRDHRDVIADDFTASYLLVFHSILSGDLSTAEDVFAHLPPAADDGQVQMQRRLAGMLSRARALGGRQRLHARDLRGWHFVITGGVLTSLASAGLEDDMNGRWAMVFDGYDTVHAGLRRAQAVLAAWGIHPPKVLALPDRGSQAVGMAAARVFGVEVNPWAPGMGDAALVVAYDLADADSESLAALSRHQQSQPLYVHAASWTAPPRVAPDLVTVLYQHLVPPWGARMRMTHGPDGRPNVENIPPDDAPAADLAENILAADPQTAPVSAETPAEVAAFAEPLYDLAAATQDSGYREVFWPGSPVESSRFA